MKRTVTILFLLILVVNQYARATDFIEHGVLDLSSHQNLDQEPVKLNGQWYFYWNRFVVTPPEAPARFIDVPGSWHSFSGSSFLQSNFGYGTYQLKIVLPSGGRTWSLYLPPIHSAYKIYVDSTLILESGKIAEDASMVPSANTKVVSFHAAHREVVLTIQVSNFYFSSGGIWSSIFLGTPAAIDHIETRSTMTSAFLMGSLLIMGLYHFGLFILRRKDFSTLYFGVICLFLMVRESFNGNALFYFVFSHVDYEWPVKLLYATFPICLITFIFFIETIYPEFSVWMKRTALVIGFAFLLMVIFLSNTLYGNFLIVVSLLFLIQSIYWLFIIVRHFKRNVRENLLVLAGVVILVSCFFNDILFEAGVIESMFLLPFGFFVFILCQSFLLAIRFSDAFVKTEMLSVELVKTNQLKEIEEMKNRFFSNITHEFRTPLTLIISPVDKMLQQQTDATLSKGLKTIQKNAIHLLRLINQLLDLSKLEARSMPVTKFSGNIVEFFKEITEGFRSIAEEKNIAIELTTHDGIPGELTFDAEKFEKILINLLSNALKFTPAQGTVAVILSWSDDQYGVNLVVKDTGIGIPSDQLAKIFDRFYQVDNSATRKYSGTGIGLSLVKELVELLGGTIQVRSSPDVGTVFNVTLPAVVVRNDVPVVFAERETFSFRKESLHTQGVRSTILVVEDNVELMEYVSQDLLNHYHVLTACDGAEAWEICQREIPDLVVSDVMMPGMDGFALCKAIKTSDTTEHIGVILLTAKAAAESRVMGLSMGANDYLPKPFHAEELRLRIHNLLFYQRTLQQYYLQSTTQAPSKDDPLPPPHPFIDKVFLVLDQHLDNSNFSIDDLASAMAISSRTLNRKLSTLVGISAGELIRNYRLRKGAELLNIGCNVSEAAYRVGFESPSYFGLCFKELYAITPSEYMRNHAVHS